MAPLLPIGWPSPDSPGQFRAFPPPQRPPPNQRPPLPPAAQTHRLSSHLPPKRRATNTIRASVLAPSDPNLSHDLPAAFWRALCIEAVRLEDP